MPLMTLSYSPDELREIVARYLTRTDRPVTPGDIDFVIAAGEPGSDPRDVHYPHFVKMTVKVKA